MAPVGFLEGLLVLRHLFLLRQLGRRLCRRHVQDRVAKGTGLLLFGRGFLKLRLTAAGAAFHVNHGEKVARMPHPVDPSRHIINLPGNVIESPLSSKL